MEELRKVEELGHIDPESVVIWVSQNNKTADHDIDSIDGDGNPKFIEVKSTVGTDGSFEWSNNEFRLAVEKADQYHLVRVYRTASLEPVLIDFSDPVRLWQEGRLALGLKAITGQVDSLRDNVQPLQA